jgi:hypothetical protein
MKRAMLMLGLGLTLCIGVHAETGGELLKDCSALERYGDKPMLAVPHEASYSYGVCMGVMYAVIDGLPSFLLHPDNGGILTIELQPFADSAQAKDVFIKYMTEHPEEENYSAITCLVNALTAKGILKMKLFDMSKVGPTDWYKKQRENK